MIIDKDLDVKNFGTLIAHYPNLFTLHTIDSDESSHADYDLSFT